MAKTQEARELLQRWANEHLLDPYGPVLKGTPQGGVPASHRQPSESKTSSPQSDGLETASNPPRPTPDSKPQIRIDRSHPSSMLAEAVDQPSAPVEPKADTESAPPSSLASSPGGTPASGQKTQPAIEHDLHSATARLHQAHAPGPSGPHFDLPTSNLPAKDHKANWMAFGGQLLAYVGIGGLTVGTTLVLWGYFGGPESYLPTGWLITTAGQMLLFLGIVTLVSGGMEQTTEEVARRMETLSERLVRIEQTCRDHALQGPHRPSETFSPDGPTQPPPEHDSTGKRGTGPAAKRNEQGAPPV